MIGAVSLRTSGVSFIMITLAFAQMLYYLGISINAYGGDDGMRLATRSQFGGVRRSRQPLRLLLRRAGDPRRAAAGSATGSIQARFGMVIRAVPLQRAAHAGHRFSTFRYSWPPSRWPAPCAGLAGALLTNQTEYLTPSFMHWTRSGEIMIMVILGGMGTLFGPVLGAIALLLLEDLLSAWTVHWQVVLGPILVLVVLYARRGLWSLLPAGARGDG